MQLGRTSSGVRVVELVGMSMGMDMDVADSIDRFPALVSVGNDSPHARWSNYSILHPRVLSE